MVLNEGARHLRKHRNGGKQTVTVQHVNVEDGGQAIVGNVDAGGGVIMKSDGNPMDPTKRLRDAPRCTATAKSTGARCNCPAVQGWNVCRVHGARGGAPRGKAHPNYKHGLRSQDMVMLRKLTSLLSKDARKLI